ncbi:vesicle-mediated transporter Bfr2/Che-1 [Blastomyces dermatitidis ATCC 18188]|uniref:Protein BFR2 n=1 Tax=Ajellomyces dermatitidis (strain ATCC 18188 / CBS 674.68) TaxID=653446 RepID=F2T209_AJEDA|nr:vesicle-mediated transporter Bfr2/Che-1 [Blastomyces dermatitidis ATCC 18188]
MRPGSAEGTRPEWKFYPTSKNYQQERKKNPPKSQHNASLPNDEIDFIKLATMANNRGRVKSLAEQIADLEDPTPKDFDPEDLNDRAESSDDQSSGAEDDNANAGREHYIAVGKSKLREPEKVTLGREYAGSRVSREALEGYESEDDPFRKDSSDEDASWLSDELDGLKSGDLGEDDSDAESEDMDNALGSDKELDGASDSESDQGFGDSSDDEGEDDQGESESEISGDEDDDEDEDDKQEDGPALSDDRAEIRRLMASDHKTVAASLSQAAKADAAKGRSVKRQRSAFGAILNARIKLQKGITSLNGLSSTLEDDNAAHQSSIQSAEAAALALWSTIEDLRHALANAQTRNTTSSSKKRKRGPPPSASTSSADIWHRMEEIEAQSRLHRRAVLDKWALKTRGSRAALPNARGKLLNHGATDQQTITSVLDAHIATQLDSRSSKRTFTEDVQERQQTNGTSNGPHEVNEMYDDSIFYQTLLRDLVEERMSANNGIETLQMQLPSLLAIHPTTGMRKDKVKRAVDTKASKGRKMRYTVHEKLQNFMPPEDRGTWGDSAREEFFASLLGKSARDVLGEDDEDEDEDVEEGGLRLFRS